MERPVDPVLYEHFNPDKSCPKCSGDVVKTDFKPLFGIGLLRRTCARCSFTWDETPLDRAPVTANEISAAWKKYNEMLERSYGG